MASKYSFAEYSEDWPREFEKEAERLRDLLGDELLAVHHIGSTSVPGLAAKPIIDVIPLVRELARIDEREGALREAGYEWWGEYGIAGRRFLTKDHEGVRTHNVHLFEGSAPEVARHLAFCAYLRVHPEISREYETLKREVYARHPADVEAYNDGKDAWIKTMEPRALAWWRERGLE